MVTENGKITAVAGAGPVHADERIDAGGRLLLAGFVDLHVHGGGGADFMDGDVPSFEAAADAHLCHGTTTLFPTTLSASWEQVKATVDVYRRVLRRGRVPVHFGGLHLEGPFLSPLMCGAQRKDLIIAPGEEHIRFLCENADAVARVTCAPEEPGVLAMADALTARGISVSMGHTMATYECAEEAVRHGFTAVTHLYSATSGFHKVNQRVHIGVTQAAYGIDALYAELIGDGRHVPRELLRLVVRFKGAGRVCLVTDAMRAAGTDVTESFLGPRVPQNRVIIEDGVAKLPDRSFYAGSVGTMDRAFRFAVSEAGLAPEVASRLCSLTPATLMGIEKEKGSIEPGKDADFVLMDQNLTVSAVYTGGRRVK